MAARRLEAREIRARLEAMCPRVHVVFAVSNAGYISRSGRVKGAQGFLGGILGIKPILGIHDGEVVPVEKVRGETNVSPRLVELLKARVDVQRPVLVGIGHAAAQQAAVRLRSLLQEQLRIAELLENEIGPAVGLHVGPGCVGAAILQPSEEELTLVTAP
jgi:DegV family protein with EDD domain